MNKTKNQQAQEYAEKKLKAFSEGAFQPNDVIADYFDFYDVRDAFEDGYTAHEQSMWHDAEKELPEGMVSVLVRCSGTDPDLGYCMACRINGSWHFYDDDFYDCVVSYWMFVPTLPNKNIKGNAE